MLRLSIRVVAVVCFFLTGFHLPALAESNWVSIDGRSAASAPSGNVIRSDNDETVIRFNIPGFHAEDILEGGTTFQSLSFSNQTTTTEVGKPALPVIRQLVAIPNDTDVRVEILSATERTLENYSVYPFQEPRRENETRAPFHIDDDFYGTNLPYPATAAEISEPAIWRDLRVITLQINPVRYNPATGQLTVAEDITVRLEYGGNSDVNVKSRSVRKIAPDLDRSYRRSVINYDFLPERSSSELTATLDGAYDYLVIAADAYLDNITPLVNWKTTQGLTTQVTPVSQIGSDVASIKTYISNEYFTNGIRYVLFVGDESDIPCYADYVDCMGMDTFYSDYYYTLLDGDDDFAELAIGRFSVGSVTELDRMVSKSVTYESNPPKGDWLEKALLIAHKEEAPEKYQACKEAIRTAEWLPRKTYDVLYPDFTTAYGAYISADGDEATNADVIAALNSGQRAVNYRGHGIEDRWYEWNVADEHFTTGEVAMLANGEMTPVIFAIACLTNDLSFSGVCLGEAFTRAANGAVAYLGASSPSWTVANEDYDRNCWALVFNDGLNTIGDVTNQAAVDIITLHGDWGIDNARMFLWLGDPALNVIYNGSMGPDAPQITSPEDGAYMDPPAQAVLDWNDVTGVVQYQIVIDNDSDFSSPVAEQVDLAVSEWTTPELGVDVYYWHVRGVDGNGCSGAWSETRKLFVGIVSPALFWPVNEESVTNADSIRFEWLAATGATGYTIQINSSTDFEMPLAEGYSDYCASDHCFYYLSPPLPRGTYYWRVKAADDGWPWSDVWQFKLRGDPSTAEDVVMHVEDMVVERIGASNDRCAGVATVTILDADGHPVPDAKVTCDFDFGTVISGTKWEITDADGVAVITSGISKTNMGVWCFTVVDVEKLGAVYSPDDNIVTRVCETGPVYRNENAAIPAEFTLGQNYPNPFNPLSEITFGLPHAAHVRLELFNILGEKVANLIDRHLEAGFHNVSIDGSRMASGVYLYRLETAETAITKKMLLVK